MEKNFELASTISNLAQSYDGGIKTNLLRAARIIHTYPDEIVSIETLHQLGIKSVADMIMSIINENEELDIKADKLFEYWGLKNPE